MGTGNSLIGSFKVIEVHLALIDLDRAGQIGGLFEQLTFLLEIPGIALHEGVLPEGHRDGVVWRLRWTDLRRDPYPLEKAQHRRWKILGSPTAYPTRIAIQTDAIRAALLYQYPRPCPQRRLGRISIMRFCRDHRGRPMIDPVDIVPMSFGRISTPGCRWPCGSAGTLLTS